MARLFTAEDVAQFIGSHADLSDESERHIGEALEAWVEHMADGGFAVGAATREMQAPERATLAGRILVAIRAYEAECDGHRRAESIRLFDHPGASIPGEAPSDAGRVEAIEYLLTEEGV